MPFPALLIVPEWIEAHCTIPDGFDKGKPFVLSDDQLWFTLNHYRVKPGAAWVPERPVLAPAFHNRRSQFIGPQKVGKGPMSATTIANEGAGPALFAGWAREGEAYECRDHGCGCGWWYEYEVGEPKGMPWPTPLIQLTATSQDQIYRNVYDPLKEMIKAGPLADLMRPKEDGSIAVRGAGIIETVTSSANSRLGQRLTAFLHDESGLYTDTNKLKRVARVQRRGAGGMGGRGIETTNMYDPAEQSTAQETFESQRPDVFKFCREPPPELDYNDPADRRKIHEFVYADAWWVDVDSVDAEAAELVEKDPAEAARFYGNVKLAGAGSWMPDALWAKAARPQRREVA